MIKSYNEVLLKKDIPSNRTINVEAHAIYGKFPLHRHEYYEVECVCSGFGTVKINGVIYDYKPGSIWLSTPVDFHELDSKGRSEIINLSFRANWIRNDLINSLSHGTVIQGYDEKIFHRYLSEYESGSHYSSVYLEASLNCILIDLIRVIESQDTENSLNQTSSAVVKAVKYIRTHFGEPITLDEVAAQVGLSPSYLSSRFHCEMQLPFQNYLVKTRLENAAKSLCSTQNLITDIAIMSGFNNYSNFTKAFKKQYEMTPAQYRKSNYLNHSD